jgi:hypothetical protein
MFSSSSWRPSPLVCVRTNASCSTSPYLTFPHESSTPSHNSREFTTGNSVREFGIDTPGCPTLLHHVNARLLPWCSGYHVRLTRERSQVRSLPGVSRELYFLLSDHFFSVTNFWPIIAPTLIYRSCL